MPLAARWAGYYVLVCAVILNWQTETSDFIYFTF